MRRISEGVLPLDDFLGRVLAQLRELVARGKAAGPLTVPASSDAKSGRPTRARKKRGKQPRTGSVAVR